MIWKSSDVHVTIGEKFDVIERNWVLTSGNPIGGVLPSNS
jgi:hypothetical protein